MEWYNVLVLILGITTSVLGIFGISAYINERMKHKANKKNKSEETIEAKKLEEQNKLRELEHQEYIEELSQIINNAIEPLAKDICEIKADLARNTHGEAVSLRTDMKQLVDSYKDRGYASAGDRANWIELYNTYNELGGNHFREYVDGWKEELQNLPFKKETIKRTKKDKLIENKK